MKFSMPVNDGESPGFKSPRVFLPQLSWWAIFLTFETTEFARAEILKLLNCNIELIRNLSRVFVQIRIIEIEIELINYM